MFLILGLSFLFNSALAENLKIIKVESAAHFVKVVPSSSIDDTDLRKYEILLDLGAEVCELSVKKTGDKEWEFSTDGCDIEKPLTKNSRIYLELKPVAPKVEPKKKYAKREDVAYNISLFYSSASTYRVLGSYDSNLNSGDIDIRGKMSGGAPGIAFGLTIPGLKIFEVDGGIGYEFARKVKSETGTLGGTSIYQDFGGRSPTFKILFLYGNLRFYMPVENLYLYVGYVYGFPSVSEEISSRMSLMSGFQAGAGYKISELLSGEFGMRLLSASYIESGTSGATTYQEDVDSFSLVGFVGALKYEL
ncbi:MAG: hypothetical protein SGJ18_14680 [Pseudomonadota bacterium]|nr:hypothetical protein [Pseudomonadota bacterium]